MLRVIAGELRGRRFGAPPGRDTRPTSDRVRESLFDLLGPIPPEARVLDLFAGSGALGIEALSRGAAGATFVESARTALAALRANLEALGLADRATVRAGDALVGPEPPGGPFHRIFADPPYGAGAVGAALVRAAAWLTDDGIVALEHGVREAVPEAPEGLALWKTRRYGDTVLSLFARTTEGSR
ncbi:MAG TPA: 16S rRNA (guanine(966)-N(2))-methyltransferase RsmD [bacterium]|nr:16S rRNA (guanine(966)-N(2))-methyltransferase RsmD [bacterium]